MTCTLYRRFPQHNYVYIIALYIVPLQINLHIVCLLATNFPPFPGYRFQLEATSTHNLPPVSYTHLDVYKRQVCVCVCERERNYIMRIIYNINIKYVINRPSSLPLFPLSERVNLGLHCLFHSVYSPIVLL